MSTLITRPTRSVPAYVQLEARALELASKAGRTELSLKREQMLTAALELFRLAQELKGKGR